MNGGSIAVFLASCATAYGEQIVLAANAVQVYDTNVEEAMVMCMFYLWALENLDANDR